MIFYVRLRLSAPSGSANYAGQASILRSKNINKSTLATGSPGVAPCERSLVRLRGVEPLTFRSVV